MCTCFFASHKTLYALPAVKSLSEKKMKKKNLNNYEAHLKTH